MNGDRMDTSIVSQQGPNSGVLHTSKTCWVAAPQFPRPLWLLSLAFCNHPVRLAYPVTATGQRHESGARWSSSNDPRFQLRVMTLDLKHTHLPPRLPGTLLELKTIIQIVPKSFRIICRYSICGRSCERGILELINPKLCRSDSVEKPIY
jgi:hypothetical protein